MASDKMLQKYLKEAIFQVKFAPILQLERNDKGATSEFEKLISKEFPNGKFETGTDELYLNSSTGDLNMCKSIWKYPNGVKTITLTENSFSLKFNKYENFEEFYNTTKSLIEILTTCFNPKVEYTGLRYINEIPASENKCLKQSLIPNIFKNDTNHPILELTSEYAMKIDEYLLICKFTEINYDFPDILNNELIVIDYDCSLRKENSNILQNFKKMHKTITKKITKDISC